MTKSKIKKPVSKGVAKVPVIMQLEELECAAASLAMVAAYYGRWVTLEQARYDCGVSRDGSNAANIKQAAKNYGFDVRTHMRNPDSIREKGVFPCIIHWDMDHFVVLCGFKGKYAYINDPANGFIKVAPGEFERSFSGITLEIVPSESFEPCGKRQSIFSSVAAQLRTVGSAAKVVFAAAVILSLFGVIYPMMTGYYIDNLLAGQDHGMLAPFTVFALILAVIQITAAWIQAVYDLKLQGKLSVVGCSTYMWKVLHMPMEFFSQRHSSDVFTRLDMFENIASAAVNTFAPLVLNTILSVLCIILMICESAALSAVALSSIAVNLFLSRFIYSRQKNLIRVMQRDKQKLTADAISGFEMIDTVKVSGAESAFFTRWAGLQAAYNKQQARSEKSGMLLGRLPGFIYHAAYGIVLIIGISYVIDGRYTLGAVWMFQGLFSALMTPAKKLSDSQGKLQELRTEFGRVQDVLQYPCDADEDSADHERAAQNKLQGRIELKNVTFGYSRLSEPVIKDLSLTIEQGKTVAIVGASGCGKSTIAKLISGLYEPWEGEILFEGRHRKEISHSVFTGSVAVVSQEITLFEGTIKNNIKMWDRSIEDFEMIVAARDAQLHDDVMRRDGGYQARLVAGGRNLSGGQRQRLEIARVLAGDPSIIILDEATSSLDAKTEYEVVKSIKDRGVSCIIIAHRLSTIRESDEIIVLDKGQISQRGTHEQLIELGGLYSELVMSE